MKQIEEVYITTKKIDKEGIRVSVEELSAKRIFSIAKRHGIYIFKVYINNKEIKDSKKFPNNIKPNSFIEIVEAVRPLSWH